MRSETHLGWRLPGERRLSARRRAKRLAAVMSCRLVTVTPATRVGDAADLAGEEGVHHLLVVDGASLVGVACEHDLLLAGRDARVGDCMNVPFCVDVGAGFAEAAEAMRERAIGCLPILAGGFLVGIVTRGDLRRAGLPAEAVAAPTCASCGRDEHVRLDPRTEGALFCLDCRERAFPSVSEDDVGCAG